METCAVSKVRSFPMYVKESKKQPKNPRELEEVNSTCVPTFCSINNEKTIIPIDNSNMSSFVY